MSHPLRYLVIHCTATPEGREVTAADIVRWHTAPPPEGNGWSRPGYTDLILLDGTVERLHPNNDDATVTADEVTNGTRGYNQTSRHIAYVGGMDSRARRPKDTRTRAQRQALAHYVLDLHRRHPEVRIVGHHRLDKSKACPSFNVEAWLREIGIEQR